MEKDWEARFKPSEYREVPRFGAILDFAEILIPAEVPWWIIVLVAGVALLIGFKFEKST